MAVSQNIFKFVVLFISLLILLALKISFIFEYNIKTDYNL